MGEVYRARDTRLDRDVAIKILPEAFAADGERVVRFQREAKVLASLNHPHIAAIYGLETADGVTALVMELVEGEDLSYRLARGAIPIEEALPIAKQIAEALEAAHEQRIIHRDLKPANIKVRPDDTVKVLDFGLAKVPEGASATAGVAQSPTITSPAMTQSGMILGTVAYMSPEQARGRAVDKRTDIWAFGCVLYEMLTGRPAFAGDTLTDTLSAIVERDPDWRALPRATPANLRRLLERCLAKDPKRRLHDVADGRIEIDDALAIPLATPSDGVAASQGRSRRAWLLLGLVSAAVVAVVILLATELVARWRRIDPPPAYHQVTFRRGSVSGARFAPDGQTIVYSAAWESAPMGLFSMRIDSPEFTSMPLPSADLLSVSASAKMAIRLLDGRNTLAEVTVAGRMPRELLNDVEDADWGPREDALAVAHVVGGRARLEYPVGTVLYDPGPGRSITYPRVSPNGERVAFADMSQGHEDHRIGIVDLHGQVRILSERWADIFGLAWAPAGDEIWFSARERELPSGGLILHAVTMSGRHRVVARMPGLPIIQQVWRDGSVLLKHDNWATNMMCRSVGDEAERDLSWLDFSRVRDMSEDGRFVLFGEAGLAEGSKGGVYLRKTDASTAVRLGNGAPLALSPDGQSVLAIDALAEQLVIVPTGAGERRVLKREGLVYNSAAWIPGAARVLVGGHKPGQPPALYVQDIGGGAPRPVVTGVDRGVVSSDGLTVATIDPGGLVTLTPLAGGSSRAVNGFPPSSELLRWEKSGRDIFARAGTLPVTILRLNTDTGRADQWRTLSPVDLSGVSTIFDIALTPDGQSYCYSYARNLSALFVVTGLE